ncbi:flagellar protein FlgN [Alkaliphilus transvaalensis]|uniref:flagellar protein FlgN n=1 Tax=Alkaliphilus transvaalensis TaxID=114628 RepID=UPI00047EB9D2|nr:flagellar protein FlgN [Alkaliphilus transvaalensis]
MLKAINQLKETLIHEDQMYGEILNLEQQKTDVIKNRKLSELEDMTKREQQYIMRMGTFERIRRSVFTNTAEMLGIEKLDSLSDFLLYLEDDQLIEEIDELRNNILEKTQQIKEVNELNEKLLEQHLDYIHFNIEVMTNHIQDHNNYGQKAQGKDKTKTNLFDARI